MKWGTEERPWPIAVTDLDSWTYFQGPGMNPLHESVEPMTDADFLARLNRTETPSAAVIIGQCFHRAIERTMIAARRKPDEPIRITKNVAATHDGATVEFNFASAGQEFRLPVYDQTEQDVELAFRTPSGWVQLRGKIDGLKGRVVQDLKTTSKSFNAHTYQDTWQWRAYLEAMGLNYRRFDFHVFGLSYGKKETAKLATGETPVVMVRSHDALSCYRYPAMRSDLQGVCADLASYLETVGWEPPPKRQMEIF